MKTADPHFATEAHEPKRDRWGRYLLPDPTTGEERAWTRATTVSNVLSDRYNLELWGQRMVMLGLAKRPDLLALVRSASRAPGSYSNKRKLNGIAKDALEAGNAEQRANLGTAIHAATEAYDRGEEMELGEPYDRDVRAYARELKRKKLRVVPGWIERIVLCPELGVAGTLDRLLECDDWTLPRIADVKTGSTVHYSHLEHSIQQAIYANASHYWDPDTETLVPVPEIDKECALIVHVPAGEGKCELHALNIAAGFDAARVAIEVREWRTRKDLSRPYVPQEEE